MKSLVVGLDRVGLADARRVGGKAAVLGALKAAGFQPREWKVESIGERTGSIWLIVE